MLFSVEDLEILLMMMMVMMMMMKIYQRRFRSQICERNLL